MLNNLLLFGEGSSLKIFEFILVQVVVNVRRRLLHLRLPLLVEHLIADLLLLLLVLQVLLVSLIIQLGLIPAVVGHIVMVSIVFIPLLVEISILYYGVVRPWPCVPSVVVACVSDVGQCQCQ